MIFINYSLEQKSKRLISIRSEIKNSFEKVEAVVKALVEEGIFSYDALNLRLGKGVGDTVNILFKAKLDALMEQGSVGNALANRSAYKHLENYAGTKILFEAISADWLKKYEKAMIEEGKSYTTVSILKTTEKYLASFEKEGKIRKIAPRIYTTNLRDAVEYIIKRHFFDILKWRFPEAVISHRSASELRPTESGNFFLTSNYTKKITDLKGITLNVMEGKPALESDMNFGGMYASSEWRWILENMQVSRKKGSESKTFSIEYIEDKLEKIIIREGEEGINKFRDKAREIASQRIKTYRKILFVCFPFLKPIF
jgi:hypothetical protein